MSDMKIYVTGLASTYELEHTARLFFSPADRVERYPAARVNAVVVHVSAKHILCAVRQNGLCAVRRVTRHTQETTQTEYETAKLLYFLLCEATGKRPPWGMLTGVRPVRLVHTWACEGKSEAEISALLEQKYFVSADKSQLAQRIAKVQQPLLAAKDPMAYSLYISIPFCPSRCSYCSFVSRTTAESGKLIAPYVDALCLELADIAAVARRNGLRLATIYIGGGTPTAISADQLRQLMHTVQTHFDIGAVQEYTVEAGRPDCTTPEKLHIIKQYGATRISINPQTLSDTVLHAIGRKHSAQDILDCFAAARAAGHDNINMDLIAGLPLDTSESFAKSLAGVMALSPENITVHTLTLKRASSLVIDSAAHAYGDVAAMVQTAQKMLAQQYIPYYLYRQKGTLGNLENTGYAKPGHIGLYNVYIMEEVHTILAAGAGGSTKLVSPDQKDILRIFNYKYVPEYLRLFESMCKRKEGVDTFYGKHIDLDSQAPR